jgi:hypothetical protein
MSKSIARLHFPALPFRRTSANARAETATLPPPQLFHRITKHPLLMPYNRLAILGMLVNLFFYLRLSRQGVVLTEAASFGAVSNLVLGNFAVAILIRQQLVVNALFAWAMSVPVNWPLSVRWAAGKIYHFGGIHVGCFFSGTVWFAILARQLSHRFVLDHGGPERIALGTLLMAYVHLLVLAAMILMALPKIRARYHNAFERTARFGGWISLAFFWAQLAIFSDGQLRFSPQYWLLLLVTFSVALPWFFLRKVPVALEIPSSHVAIARFDYGITPFAGSSTDISRNPLLEWHSFANVPAPGINGFRLTISRAGDWTGALINDKPSHVWVKGIPTAGVGNIETVFKRVIWVATGSGIGPCLPHLFTQKVPSRLVWSTRSPKKTYGPELVDHINAVQPGAVIWDTDQNGKPDLVQLAYEAYVKFDAEAVICISNKKVTWNLVYQLESRGIPAFGAIWDS